MRKPNLFLVGAPKCGTTAMYTYLSQHPEIYMCPVKEPNFFSEDVFCFNSREQRSEADYLSLFQGVKDEKYIGEASSWYLYSQKAALKIKAFSPDGKIIIMLRNPVDMIYSLHSQLVYGGLEHITNFEKALEAESNRRKGLDLPKYSIDGLTGKRLLYREIAQYSNQVKRYFDIFDRNNVHIIIYDDFRDNTVKIYKELLLFLDVSDSFIPEFKIYNTNKTRRIKGNSLQRIRNHPLIVEIVQSIFPYSLRSKLYRYIASLYSKINTVHTERIEINSRLRQSLQKEFSQDVRELSELLNRDLTYWIG
ncbi:MAG: sulfotransferase domain-containing protein [Bacteroidales bacterium]